MLAELDILIGVPLPGQSTHATFPSPERTGSTAPRLFSKYDCKHSKTSAVTRNADTSPTHQGNTQIRHGRACVSTLRRWLTHLWG